MALTPKQAALQVAYALPVDATLEDAQEFIWERDMVERGRRDIAAGAVDRPGELANMVAAGLGWAKVALEDFRDTVSRWTERDKPEDLWSAVAEALARISADPGLGVSLPELGDPAILEIL